MYSAMSDPQGFMERFKDEAKMVVCGTVPHPGTHEAQCDKCSGKVYVSRESKEILDQPKSLAICIRCVGPIKHSDGVYLAGKMGAAGDQTGERIGSNIQEVLEDLATIGTFGMPVEEALQMLKDKDREKRNDDTA